MAGIVRRLEVLGRVVVLVLILVVHENILKGNLDPAEEA